MCYFNQIVWSCGYWRWSHFRQQCSKEYRTGETCGLKLVYEASFDRDTCKLCKDIDKKKRRYAKLESDIARWDAQPNRRASVEKAIWDKMEVQEAMEKLQEQHRARTLTTS